LAQGFLPAFSAQELAPTLAVHANTAHICDSSVAVIGDLSRMVGKTWKPVETSSAQAGQRKSKAYKKAASLASPTKAPVAPVKETKAVRPLAKEMTAPPPPAKEIMAPLPPAKEMMAPAPFAQEETMAAPPLLSLPPGLSPPPGLPAPPGLDAMPSCLPAETPPGLEPPIAIEMDSDAMPESSTTASSESPSSGSPSLEHKEDPEPAGIYAVLISGLPNEILKSKTLMEAMLQQAGGLDSVCTGFNASLGKPCGEVLVSLSNRRAAEWCVHHFEGCQWDASGAIVSAKLISPLEEESSLESGAVTEAAAATLSAEALAFEPMKMEAPAFSADALAFEPAKVEVGEVSALCPEASLYEPWSQAPELEAAAWLDDDGLFLGNSAFNGVNLSSEAAPFEPMGFSADAMTFMPAEVAGLSAKAPVFEPQWRLSAEAPSFVPGLAEEMIKIGITSDTSTETGESESDDEKEGSGGSAVISRSKVIAAT